MIDLSEELATRLIDLSTVTLPEGAMAHAQQLCDVVLTRALLHRDDPLVGMLGAVFDEVTPRRATPSTIGPTDLGAFATSLAAGALVGVSPEAISERLSVVATVAALTTAQLRPTLGLTLLRAIALGAAAGEHLTVALGTGHQARGWDPIGSAGRFAAGVASGVVLGLNAAQLRAAIGFTSTTAGGLSIAGAQLGVLTGALSARDGVEAALLAHEGLIGPPLPLEGRRGLFALVAPEGEPEALLAALGHTWVESSLGSPQRFHEAVATLVNGEVDPLMRLFAAELAAER